MSFPIQDPTQGTLHFIFMSPKGFSWLWVPQAFHLLNQVSFENQQPGISKNALSWNLLGFFLFLRLGECFEEEDQKTKEVKPFYSRTIIRHTYCQHDSSPLILTLTTSYVFWSSFPLFLHCPLWKEVVLQPTSKEGGLCFPPWRQSIDRNDLAFCTGVCSHYLSIIYISMSFVIYFGYNPILHYLFWCLNCFQLWPLGILPIDSCITLHAISEVCLISSSILSGTTRCSRFLLCSFGSSPKSILALSVKASKFSTSLQLFQNQIC